MLDEGLALFATDARPRYKNDVLRVLALPHGAAYQFRYESKYIPAEIRHFLIDHLAGKPAVISFRSQPSGTGEEAIVPVRLATFIRAEQFADFFILHYQVGGYPKSSLRADSIDNIYADSKRYLDGLPAGHRALPVQRGYGELVQGGPAEPLNGWLEVARALSRHPTYADSHFVKLAGLQASGEKFVVPDSEGTYEVKENKLYHLSVQYYAEQFGAGDSTLHIAADPSVVRSASTIAWPLDSRYDSITSWLHVRGVPGSTKTEIKIDVLDKRVNSPQTHIVLPLIVRRSQAILTRQTVLSALSGALIASPAIIGDGSSLTLRLTLAGAGSLLLAFVTNVFKRSSR